MIMFIVIGTCACSVTSAYNPCYPRLEDPEPRENMNDNLLDFMWNILGSWML